MSRKSGEPPVITPEQGAYKSYVAYCYLLRIKPAEFKDWRQNSARVGANSMILDLAISKRGVIK